MTDDRFYLSKVCSTIYHLVDEWTDEWGEVQRDEVATITISMSDSRGLSWLKKQVSEQVNP